MAGKPRPSLLDLFDPLLANAVNLPIPESPPTTPNTPHRVFDRCVENKENLAPDELTMSVFFNRISRTTCSPNMKVLGPSSGQLVELEDAEDESKDCRLQLTPRLPLTELSLDNFSSQAVSSSLLLYKQTMSPRQPQSSGTTLPPSPLRQTHLTFPPVPAISVSSVSNDHDSLAQTTQSPIDLLLPENVEPWRGSLQTSSSNALVPPNNNNKSMHKPSRRRSSIDISTTLTSFSSSTFNFQDASFDLVNGEISFLSRSSEDIDMDRHVLVDSSEPCTPRAKLSSQTVTSEENLGDSSSAASHLSEDIHSTNMTRTQPTVGQAETCSQRAHYQQQDLCTLSSGFTGSSCAKHPPTEESKTASTLGLQRQSTPPSARRVSSVPAPTKKAKVFTSKQHRAANASAKRGMVPTSSVTRSGSITSANSLTESTARSSTTYSSGIPRGSAGRRPVVGSTGYQCTAASQRTFTAKPTTTNLKVPGRRVGRSVAASAFHKGETTEKATSRMGAVSRLPGPAVARIGSVPSERHPRLPGFSQRERSDIVRSTSSGEASHTLR